MGSLQVPGQTDAAQKKNKTDPKQTRRLLAIDLFAGCGGLSEGLRQAGFTVIGAVDVDPIAIEAYRLNHKETDLHQTDITLLDGKQWMTLLGLNAGELDLLAGCPPCQGFSSMRTKNGGCPVDDPQNDLIFEFLRLVEDFQPKAIMLENVPALGVDRRIRLFKRRLRELGYKPRDWVLNAADYNVPQRRKRFILLAGQSGNIHKAKRCTKRKTVRSTIGGIAPVGTSGDPHHDMTWSRSTEVQERIAAIPKDGGSREALGPTKQLPCHVKIGGFRDVYGRLAWEEVSPTITTGCFNPSKGRFLHPQEDRPITLREAALLQSFPREYQFPKKGREKIARLIGNALPPEFIRRHGLKVKAFVQRVP